MDNRERDRQESLEAFKADLLVQDIDPIEIQALAEGDATESIQVSYRASLLKSSEMGEVEVERAMRLAGAYLEMVHGSYAEDSTWRPGPLQAAAIDTDRERAMVWTLPFEATHDFIKNELDGADMRERIKDTTTLREDVTVDYGTDSFS